MAAETASSMSLWSNMICCTIGEVTRLLFGVGEYLDRAGLRPLPVLMFGIDPTPINGGVSDGREFAVASLVLVGLIFLLEFGALFASFSASYHPWYAECEV